MVPRREMTLTKSNVDSKRRRKKDEHKDKSRGKEMKFLKHKKYCLVESLITGFMRNLAL